MGTHENSPTENLSMEMATLGSTSEFQQQLNEPTDLITNEAWSSHSQSMVYFHANCGVKSLICNKNQRRR
ncbi:hypothetical protein EV213_102248 [Aureibacillus halotolerans]|uniref:Uncharacterized protein n=1 Tax=Aureibacillus halotolerans TaxID=1508390 RepID=A0A4V3D635_9BACI|nr:hypothetical protein EV213_102248 [Aureibacillus halotolerans]